MKKTWGIGTACAVALTLLALPVSAANSTPDLGEILKALSRQAADRTTAAWPSTSRGARTRFTPM